ncbi:tubulin polyglutamylase TTLL5 isoform X2 [Ambystoma mexicanum]|uniref:tubulin polyglutamylase TTLL5 isoform X2 n=1 Tax=Ambystoma mexicanum TaxID=8296 RepID=UPI0037E871F8
MPARMTRAQEETASSSSEAEEDKKLESHACIHWSGGSKKIPIIIFHAEAILTKETAMRLVGERYHLGFKIVRTDSRLVRSILGSHGFQEVPQNSNEFNLMWTGSHLKPYLMRNLLDFQKVNHFPRSYELTRKDRLYKNVHRMQQSHGFKNFNFLPQTFMLPTEYQEFCNAFTKDRGPWIVKPVASSRGRGVYLINSPNQISLEENILVSRYINQPLLIDDFKFDVRLYVLVTSYDPLVIYLYEEGLARFATVRYDKAAKNIKNQFMHLTNYSVNKKSADYVSCDDPEVEDYGNKWSMSAMLRYLKQEGKDTAELMAHVEDLIIKAVVSAEMAIASACKTFVPHRGVCFELYGFDVLIDANLKPWLLEVNLSPSLACDAPLDLKVKASMLSDMFTLVGLVCHDPTQRYGRATTFEPPKRSQSQKQQRQRPLSASDVETNMMTASTKEKTGKTSNSVLSLTMDEVRTLRKVNEEWERRGGFIRIFPRVDTWELYGPYLEFKTTLNYVLSMHLFTDRGSKGATVGISRVRTLRDGGMEFGISSSYSEVKLHAALYERKLLSLEMRKRRRRHGKPRPGLVQRAGTSKPTTAHQKVELESEEEEGVAEESDETEETSCIPGAPSEPRKQAQPVPTKESACQENALKEQKGLDDQGQSSPEPPPVNLMMVLRENGNLSKVQARMAFSAYLQRVRQRLNTEVVDQSQNYAWAAKEDEQMDLVVRFLKRAAANLQQSLRMVLPGRRLPLMDRRRILAYQLGEFLQYYNQETDHMVQKKALHPPPECAEDEVNHQQFQSFVKFASESELEEVLTFYTQKNKSASVFLGANPKIAKTSKSSDDSVSKAHDDRREKLEPIKEIQMREEKEHQAPADCQGAELPKTAKSSKTSTSVDEESRAAPPCPPSSSGITGNRAGVSQPSSHSTIIDTSRPSGQQLPLVSTLVSGPGTFTGNPLVQMSSSTSSSSPGQSAAGNWAYPAASSSSQASNSERIQRSRSGILAATSVSSLQSAAQIYSQRLSRPSSAKAVGCHQSPSRHRSGMFGGLKEREDGITQSTACNHSAVATALQRLVEKQANRQYSTSSHLGLLTQQLTNMNLASGALSRFSSSCMAAHRPAGTAGGPVRVLHPDTQENATHTPPRFRAPEMERLSGDGDMESSAYSMVTGVPPQQKYHPTASSYQLQYAVQQLELQRLQTRQLLEQSRARHQVVFSNQQYPISSQYPLPENSGTHWTGHILPSNQKMATQKATSTSQHVPKPPVNHKQVLLRKTPSQRPGRVSSVDSRPDGFHSSLRSTTSSEPISSPSGALNAPEIIFARSKADIPSSAATKRDSKEMEKGSTVRDRGQPPRGGKNK